MREPIVPAPRTATRRIGFIVESGEGSGFDFIARVKMTRFRVRAGQARKKDDLPG
jgi:hypothetical protein